MASATHNARKNRESLTKRMGKVGRQIRERDGHRCQYCGATKESTGFDLHLDHLIPESKGGQDVATNLVVACISCNSARKALSLAEWQRKAAGLGIQFTTRRIWAQARKPLPELPRKGRQAA